jgi:hypothetical protein
LPEEATRPLEKLIQTPKRRELEQSKTLFSLKS